MVSGERLTVALRSAAHARVTALLRVVTHKLHVTGTGKQRKRVTQTVVLYQAPLRVSAGKHGQYSARGKITYRTGQPVAAMLTVTGRGSCGAAARTAGITIEPRPTVSLHPQSVVAGGMLTISVHAVPKARVAITLRITGTRLVKQGNIKRHKTVVLYQTSTSGTADAHGLFTGRLRVRYKPGKQVSAHVAVTMAVGKATATTQAQATILPH